MHTGFYYVYSNVVFETDSNVDHVVVKEKKGYVILLLTCDLFVVTCREDGVGSGVEEWGEVSWVKMNLFVCLFYAKCISITLTQP